MLSISRTVSSNGPWSCSMVWSQLACGGSARRESRNEMSIYHACMHACMYVCMYVYIYICIYIYMYYMYVYIYILYILYIRISIYMCVCVFGQHFQGGKWWFHRLGVPGLWIKSHIPCLNPTNRWLNPHVRWSISCVVINQTESPQNIPIKTTKIIRKHMKYP